MTQQICERVWEVGVQDPDRRLFDALMPLPRGTTYNAYLVRGSEKTALLDTVDPSKAADLFRNLEGVDRLDYVVCHHAEQDHSGSIPDVLARYPAAQVLCLRKTMDMLRDLMPIAEDRFRVVEDGETVSLGDRSLQFLHLPWVHWPETTATWLPEDRILFSCDLFGAHLAFENESDLDPADVIEAAKEYYAAIMMPYAKVSAKHLDRIAALTPAILCPSHGPIHRNPAGILEASRDWMCGEPKNLALIAWVSTHGSTRLMAERLAEALRSRGVDVVSLDLTRASLNELAAALVDAKTVVIGSSAILSDLHPSALHAAILIDMLKPKARHVAFFGSYGWSAAPFKKIAERFPKVEALGCVTAKGHPNAEALAALDTLAEGIGARHHS